MPWQSGQVLLIYRKDMTGGDLTSINDLFDPKFKGKVTMLTEMRDTVGSVLLGEGIDPEKATKDQALAAIEKIEKASKDGQIRRFTGNEYATRPAEGRLHRGPRLVGRRGARSGRQPEHRVQAPRGGVHGLHRHHADPGRRAARVHGRRR